MISRRDFFAVLGGGIVVWMVDDADAQESGGGQRRGMNRAMPEQVSAWLHIGEEGTVTAYTGKVEVGQNARTSLTQAVAEELRVPVSSIRMIMGDTALTPFDMGTFGSQTTPRMWPQMRKAGGGRARNAGGPGGAEVDGGPRVYPRGGWQSIGGRQIGRFRGIDKGAEAHPHHPRQRSPHSGGAVEGGRAPACRRSTGARSSPARTSTPTM